MGAGGLSFTHVKDPSIGENVKSRTRYFLQSTLPREVKNDFTKAPLVRTDDTQENWHPLKPVSFVAVLPAR